ncbi:hypothetical protein RHOSPDRAFT_14030 [Rhodotorula sp. JG-1b]|nr:hypothetical protein RHOSPDRAFT_14030 [Rhodotorula sp. JG-1b]
MELPATQLRLPAALPYPLTVQRIHAQPGAHVQKTQRLFTYSFLPNKPDELGRRERQVREWDSPVLGQVIAWDVREGDIIREPRPIVKVQEPCTHDVQLNGLCAICGKDLTATDYTGFSDTSRATISMVHDVGGLTVSLEEAHRLESATATRLLQAKKLSLIVDLDQTIVHATVDPTVGEWLQDPDNPNYKALEGVKRFKLLDETPMRRPKKSRTSTATTTPGLSTPVPTPGLSESGTTDDGESVDEDDAPGCYYYIKMRPGLPDFLKRIAEIYEMHVYTMGTRAYAIEVCKVIDPDGGLFGGRILSRDESGSMTRKSLQRLFPCDTNMVVIIDDRADVWDGSPNLVKVIPYEFFVGIGDINAAFLPKKKELVPPPVAPLASPSIATEVNPEGTAGSASPFDAAVSSGESSRGGERSTTPLTSPSPGPAPSLSPPQASSSPSTSSASVAEAAVHHLHLPDEILSEPTRISDLVVSSSPEEVVSPSLKEALTSFRMSHSDQILTSVRDRFYQEHESRGASDVATIIPAMKAQTLRETNLVFSGLVALGTRPEDSEYWKLATTFGATCSNQLSPKTTHLVANQPGTAKVHSARRFPRVKVVYPQWLLDSVAKWVRLEEGPYLLPTTVEEQRPPPPTPPSPVRPELSDGESEAKITAAAGGTDTVETTGGDEVDLDLADLDWGDAMKEVDDLLLETDDDDDLASLLNGGDETTDGESDAGVQSAPPPGGGGRKRPLSSTPSSESVGSNEASSSASAAAESPLQKRVKTARSRRSGLKTSLSAAAAAASSAAEGNALAQASAPVPPPSDTRSTADGASSSAAPSNGKTSSSIGSDDEDLLAMAADLESGWS